MKGPPVQILEGDPVLFDPRHQPLFASDTWGVLLFRNQTYLGRSIVYLRTRPLPDLLGLTRAERDELWDDVMPRLRAGLDATFAPDRLNYAHLANRTHHVHWHVVPRYDTVPHREFAGHDFYDDRQGQLFRTKKRGRVPAAVREAIAAAIVANLPPSA